MVIYNAEASGSVTSLATVFGGTAEADLRPVPSASSFSRARSPREYYNLFRAYYYSNRLYENISAVLRERDLIPPATLPLRNPTRAAVNFYRATVWPGSHPEALPLRSDNGQIEEPIRQVHEWSNLAFRRQVAVTWAGMLGDVWGKVEQLDDGRPTIRFMEPDWFVDYEEDFRGVLRYVRVDIPKVELDARGVERHVTRTETWNKSSGLYRYWEHTRGFGCALDRLGRPDVEEPIESFGFDFIPYKRLPFHDSGDDRGLPAIAFSLDKIDEANRMATRLHQMLFRYNRPYIIVKANATDKTGRPARAPRLGDADGNAEMSSDGDSIWYVPGMADVAFAIPNIRYADALEVLRDHLVSLEDMDLPELRYTRLRDSGLSGRAIAYLLSGAIDNARSVRGNMEAGLIQLEDMALSVGAAAGIFRNIGEYERGDFRHWYEERGVLPLSELDEADVEKAQAETAEIRQRTGWSVRETLRRQGLSEREIDQMIEETETTDDQIGGALIRAFNRGGDAGREVSIGEGVALDREDGFGAESAADVAAG